ncbi:unnamed protein product, partial [Rotaria sp. Silwood1]
QYKLNQVGFRRKAKLTFKQKNELKEVHAQWICTDFRPFTILEDYGFEHLANIAEHGLVDAKELLPSWHTVTHNVDDLAAK